MFVYIIIVPYCWRSLLLTFAIVDVRIHHGQTTVQYSKNMFLLPFIVQEYVMRTENQIVVG